MKLTLSFSCPCCQKPVSIEIGGVAVPPASTQPTIAVSLNGSAAPPAKPSTKAACACGHGPEFHGSDGKGPCTYGHGTAHGGCNCPRYHSKRQSNKVYGRAQPEKSGLGKCERLILTVLPPGVPMHLTEVAIRTGYARNGGGFLNSVSALRSAGYIAGSGEIVITEDGVGAIQDCIADLPDVLEFWWNKLGKCPKGILQGAVSFARTRPGQSPTREWLASAAGGYEPTGGGFLNSLSELRGLGLLDGDRASDALMRAIGGST